MYNSLGILKRCKIDMFYFCTFFVKIIHEKDKSVIMTKKLLNLRPIFFCSVLLLIMLITTAKPALCDDMSMGAAYKIGSGDILSITITAGGEEQARAELTVSSKGDINVPFIGNIKAVGHTTSELESIIARPLEAGYFMDPQVNIQMKEFHNLKFFISGAVSKPGMYELNFYPSVMDMIAQAGGVSEGRGKIAYILKKTTRKMDDTELEAAVKNESVGGEPIRVDLMRLLDKGDMSQNFRLEAGDTVYIPLDKELDLTQTKIYVEGEVKSPGGFDYQPGLTALRACIMAGGFAKYAAPNRTRIIRKNENGKEEEIIKIDLEKVKVGKISDVPLQPGDRIHVPETWL